MDEKIVRFMQLRQTGDIDSQEYRELNDYYLHNILKNVKAYDLDSLNRMMKQIWIIQSKFDKVFPYVDGKEYYAMYGGVSYPVNKKAFAIINSQVKEQITNERKD